MQNLDLQAVRGRIALAQRLAQLHLHRCPEPPAGLLAEDEGPHDDLLRYRDETGLSLDWLLTGDPNSLIVDVMRARQSEAEDLAAAEAMADTLEPLTEADFEAMVIR